VVGIDEFSAMFGGGAVGRLNAGSTVSETISRGSVYMINGNAGGFVGYSLGNISDCAAFGNCEGYVSAPAGGFAGTQAGGSIDRCYSTGLVKNGLPNWGGFAGARQAGTDSSTYFDSATSGTASSAFGTPRTHIDMSAQGAYTGFDFSGTWEMIEGESYPTPIALSTYQPLFGNDREYLIRFRIHRPTNRAPESWGGAWDGELISNQLLAINGRHMWEPIFVRAGQLDWSVESQFGDPGLVGKNTIGASGSAGIATDTVIEANAVWNDTNAAWKSIEPWLKPKLEADDTVLEEKYIAYGFISGTPYPISNAASLSVNGIPTPWMMDPMVFHGNPAAWIYYRAPMSGFDWAIAQGDLFARGTMPDGASEDTLILAMLRYFAFMHGESNPMPDPDPMPFPAPETDMGGSVEGTLLAADEDMHGGESMAAMHFYTAPGSEPFSNPVLKMPDAATGTIIPWNPNPLPATLAYNPGRYAFRPVNVPMDYFITDGDFFYRGASLNTADSTTEVAMKYWAFVHGEETVMPEPDPVPFPAPEDDIGGTCAVELTADMEYEARQALATWVITKYEDGTPLTGYELYLNGRNVGVHTSYYIDHSTDVDWHILTPDYQARGTFRMNEDDITITATAKLNRDVPASIDGMASDADAEMDFEVSAENSIRFEIVNTDRAVPRSGYAVRAWKALSGVDGTTPEYILPVQAELNAPPVYGAVGITLPPVAGDTASGAGADTWVWEITNGSWYASGTVVVTNAPQTLNVLAASVYGEMTDPRDGKTYRTVMMPDGKLWAAQNLDYAGFGTGAYYGSPVPGSTEEAEIAGKYGRMYTSDEALNGQSYTNLNPSARQGAAPAGWHIPSDSEWTQLMHAVDPSDTSTYGDNGDAEQGMYLKANAPDWDGDDEFGFRALPGGRQINGIFDGLGILTEFASCTDYNFTTAILRSMDSDIYHVARNYTASKTNQRMYVRFIKDRVN
jgi:uncharacterized protein (TIGR02145 family)